MKRSVQRLSRCNDNELTWAAAAITDRKTLTVASRECVAYEFVAYVCPGVRRCGRKRWINRPDKCTGPSHPSHMHTR